LKPILLRFSGINSYRTIQEINFEELGTEGLFGIFGPTGSGKSSILDAITLALYGSIERASNNTRGIIHQLENALEVFFEFELGDSRYLVERRYERNPKDPDSAVAKQARIRKLDSRGQEVLAAKPQEVTAKIEEILGIGKAEFSRAVVLPQGKFDQFLRLTGADRAAMLEHLFNLEQFGEALVAKIKNETSILNGQLQKIDGEEQGIGDCSEETITLAVSTLAAIHEEYGTIQKGFEVIDQSYKEASSLRELFTKRQAALRKQAELEREHATIEQKQAHLNVAEKAEPFRELLMRQIEIKEKIETGNILLQKNLRSHSEAVHEWEKTRTELESAEKILTTELPKLEAQKVFYKGALDKQGKLLELQKEARIKKQEYDGIAEKITALEKEIGACQGMLVNNKTTLATLQTSRSKFIVNPDEKELVGRAADVLLHLEESEKRFQDHQQNYGKRKIQNERLWLEVVAKVREILPGQALSPSEDIEKWTHSLIDKAEKDLESLRIQYQQALIANSAAELVKQLHEGEPCPVCGSRLHPDPAVANIAVTRLETTLRMEEKKLKDSQNWRGQVLKIWHEWVANEPLIGEAYDAMEKSQKEYRDLLSQFDTIRGDWDREGLRRRKQQLIEFEKQLAQFDQRRDALQKTQEELNDKLLKSGGALQTLKSKDAEVREALKNFKTQILDISGELQSLTGGQDVTKLISETDKAIQQYQVNVESRKGKEADARSALEGLAKEKAVLEASMDSNRSELIDVEKRLTTGLQDAGFTSFNELEQGLMSLEDRQTIRKELEAYRQEAAVARNELETLISEINNRSFDEATFGEIECKRKELLEKLEHLKADATLAQNRVEELQGKQVRWKELEFQKATIEKRKSLAESLGTLLRGRKFVSFLAEEHLRDMTLEASFQLGRLTGQRYALELAKEKDCEFVIRDDFNGGNRRSISSLSGGEIFMTSLALALALSSKIQLRGRYPLGFFFLDEGFGTLDEEKLDKVMNALEKLHDKNRIVGVISHVRELKERLPRYLEVVPAGEDGSGSLIQDGRG
jgi:exonuclease SbcC